MNNIKLSEEIYEYDDIRERVELRLVRNNDNDELMNTMPCVDFGQLNALLVFYVRLGVVNGVELGFYITNDHMKLWDISAMKLFEDMIKA